jgi:hypothetical protein
MAGLFISYRRQDSASYAHRLYADLGARYGSENVLLDVADISPGQDFAASLRAAVAACRSVLVVVGPHWLDAADVDNRRRLDDPTDFIRSEVGEALRSGKPAIPVLVGGAVMPQPDDLPPDLRRLTLFPACELTDARWESDLTRLWQALDQTMAVSSMAPRARGPGAIAPFMTRVAHAFDILVGRSPGRAGADQTSADALANSAHSATGFAS